MAIEACLTDESNADPRLPHHLGPNQLVPVDDLAEQGVLYWRLHPSGYENDQQPREIREPRGYKYRGMLDICPEKLEIYKEKLKNFYLEHIHDRWIRVWIMVGDLLILPAGIYRRFTLGTTSYVKESTEVFPEKLSNYEGKRTALSGKHDHTDEQIRRRIDFSGICCCLPGSRAGKTAFSRDDGASQGPCEPSVKDLLLAAQKEFKIFNEDIVTKAFYEAEKAHRGQGFCMIPLMILICVMTVYLGNLELRLLI